MRTGSSISEETGRDVLELAKKKVAMKQRNRARRMADTEDLVNDIVLFALEGLADYDPARGPLTTFLSYLVDKGFSNAWRHRLAAKRDSRRVAFTLGRLADVFWTSRPSHLEKVIDMKLDLAEFETKLSIVDRRLCDTLRIEEISSAAVRCGLHRGTVHRRLKAINRRHRDSGLPAYVT